MERKAAILAEARRLRAAFEAAGAAPVETNVLQPAETLLDLYGEDIRARAYVTQDPLHGERMLRPDFTVPVALHHIRHGSAPARYTYAGEVFRRQEDDPDRPSEYVQVGLELFDTRDAAGADAEVFSLFAGLLAPLGLRMATGDIGLLIAAVRGLSLSEARKAALMRHLWRPRRFRALLDRYGKPAPPPPEPAPATAPEIGLRTAADIAARLEALRAEATEPPLGEGERALLDRLLGLSESAERALGHLRELAGEMPSIAAATDSFARRLDALDARGIAPAGMDFEASYGRTALEYYDGFVFGFYAEGRPELPPVATGGRYDALMRRLGGGAGVSAVGGVIRPGLALEVAGC